MEGYIAIVLRRDSETYHAEIVDIPGLECSAPTVEAALHGARVQLRRRENDGGDLPDPRPSHEMIEEVERRSAVAGACLCSDRLAA
ncbi:MAG: hypothetical protein RBS99_10360 [Rhodospirillales bacterium]|jgi:hypothetical protein|nr:hypothetical protein [Rhodospirillales bacterium]